MGKQEMLLDDPTTPEVANRYAQRMADEGVDETRAAVGHPEPETAAVTQARIDAEPELAWSIDNPAVEDDVDYRGASWRRVAAIGAVIAAVAAVVTGGIIAWGHRQPTPASAPPTAAKPAPIPQKPPAWQPNGTYRVEHRNPEGTIRNGATGAVEPMSDLGVSTSTVWEAWKTECTPTNCTARTIALDDVTHQHADGTAALSKWNGTEWESTGGEGPNGGHTHPLKCVGGPGADTLETWATMSPLPDGSFRGTFHRTFVKTECPGALPGDQQDVPMVVVRIGDTPQGVF